MKRLRFPGYFLMLIFLLGFVEGRSQVSLVFKDTIIVTSNQDFVLPVNMQMGHDISAISLGFIFPEEYLEVIGMEMTGGIQGYFYNVIDSLFQMAWSAVDPITIADNGLVISLGMRSKDLSGLVGTIKLELSGNCEFADDSANIIDPVILEIPEIGLPLPPDTSFYVKVYPNPFRDIAKIEFYLEKESKVKIEICNALGESMGTIAEGTFPEGFHQVRLANSYLRKGVYFLKFEEDDGKQTNSRLIKIISYP